MTAALFLSPHLDDVAFSCGGTLRDHRTRGDATLVISVFAGAPPAELVIRPLHRDLGSDLHALWRRRIDEDLAAMRGLDSEHLHLGFCDAAFRPETERWSHIWGAPTAATGPLRAALETDLVARWRARGRPPVYAPLGVGAHVDHVLCFEVAGALERAGAVVWHYEELPYAARAGVLERRLAELGAGWRSREIDVAPHLDTVAAASRCYPSQLAGVVLPARPTERLWARS